VLFVRIAAYCSFDSSAALAGTFKRKSHGAVTVGKDIVEAFVPANYLEENAYRQYMALQIGKPYSFSEEELALCRETGTPGTIPREAGVSAA
jgi:ribulose-5-phosphate 4-epimerase/fuculose-1-phosphate aldolase